jgi:hypothetical protein
MINKKSTKREIKVRNDLQFNTYYPKRQHKIGHIFFTYSDILLYNWKKHGWPKTNKQNKSQLNETKIINPQNKSKMLTPKLES